MTVLKGRAPHLRRRNLAFDLGSKLCHRRLDLELKRTKSNAPA